MSGIERQFIVTMPDGSRHGYFYDSIEDALACDWAIGVTIQRCSDGKIFTVTERRVTS